MKRESVSELRMKMRSVLDLIATSIVKNIRDDFISENCNAMQALRYHLIDNRDVDYAYGCGAHVETLNSFCKYLMKLPNFELLFKMFLIVLK